MGARTKTNKRIKGLIKQHDLEDIVSTTGKECWSFLVFKDTKIYSQWELKTLFLQEVFARGILTLGSHNISYAHSDADSSKLLGVYNEVFCYHQEYFKRKKLR